MSSQISQFSRLPATIEVFGFRYKPVVVSIAFSLCYAGVYPNIRLQGTGAPEITPIGTLFIYRWTAQEQAKCPGYVTAFEYCFQRTTNTPTRPVFTFFLLEPISTGYNILQKFDVTSRDFTSCSNRRGVDTCCLRQSLEQNNWFQVPVSASGAYGIYSIGSNRILGVDPELMDYAVGLQIPSDRKDDTRITTNAPLSMINYRLFNMVIGKVMLAIKSMQFWRLVNCMI